MSLKGFKPTKSECIDGWKKVNRPQTASRVVGWRRWVTPRGVARATSPYARYGPPGLRSLDDSSAFGIRAFDCCQRRLSGTGNPSQVDLGRDAELPATVAVTAVVAVPVAYYFGVFAAIGVAIIGVVFVSAWRALEIKRGVHAIADVSLFRDFKAAAFVQAYVTVLGSFAVALVSQPNGQWWTLAFLIIVVSVDTGAYVSGLNFGKHPMAPKISPKKTWEGFAGAGVAAIIAAVLLSIFMLGQPWWFGLILGPILLVTATLGDLGESHIKRTIGVKDMSSWLAGHGGFLDRLDSILPSALVTYVIYVLVVH